MIETAVDTNDTVDRYNIYLSRQTDLCIYFQDSPEWQHTVTNML